MASAHRETSFPHFVLLMQPLCFDSRACEEYFKHRWARNVSVFFGLRSKIPRRQVWPSGLSDPYSFWVAGFLSGV